MGWSPVQQVLPTLCKISNFTLILNGNKSEDLIRQMKEKQEEKTEKEKEKEKAKKKKKK
jgi:hypothetical protein